MKRTSSRTFAAAIVFALSTLLMMLTGIPSAQAETAFSPASVLSDSDSYNVVPTVALDGAGNMLTSWFTAKLTVDASHNPNPTGPWSIMQRRRSAAGTLEPAKAVFTSKPGAFDANTPTSASNEDGDVISAWGSYGSPVVNILSGTVKDGYSSDITTRAIGDSGSGYPTVAESADGSAIIAWDFVQNVKGNTIRKVAYVIRDASGKFSDVHQMPAALSGESSELTTDIDAAGDIAVAYTIKDQAFVARGTIASGLGGQYQVSGIEYEPKVRFAGDGTAVIIGGDSANGVGIATLGGTGSVSAFVPIAEPDHPSEASATATTNGSGGVVISWIRYGKNTPMRHATWTPGSGLGATSSVDVPGLVCSPVNIAARAGAMLATWSTCDQPVNSDPTYRAVAAYLPADGSAATVTALGDLNFNTYPVPALDGDGDGVVVWHGIKGDPKALAPGASFNADISISSLTIDHPVAHIDPVAPVVSKLTLKPAKFKACVKKQKHCGSKLGFNLSESASLSITFQRVVRKKVKHRVKVVRKSAGTQAVKALAAGIGRISLNGKAGGKVLKPGRYRLTVIATSGTGLKSVPVAKSFRVLKG